MPPLRKMRLPPLSPSSHFASQYNKMQHANLPHKINTSPSTPTTPRKPSAKTAIPLSPVPAALEDTPSRRQAKVVAACSVAVLLCVAMAANAYMALYPDEVVVVSSSSSKPAGNNNNKNKNGGDWDRATAFLMVASFGELACSMTLVTLLATISPAFLWGCMAGLMGLGGFVVAAIVHGVGGPATAVFLGFAVFWSAFLVELRVRGCPVLVRWFTTKVKDLPPSSSAAAAAAVSALGITAATGEGPLLPVANEAGVIMSKKEGQQLNGGHARSSSFDDGETLYSPSSDGEFVVNIHEK